MAPKHRQIRNIPETKGEDFFANIPPEIILNILSRLPIPTVMRCKCVCKSWLDSVKSPEFAMSHASKSVRGLALDEGVPLTLAMYRGETFLRPMDEFKGDKFWNPYEIVQVVDSRHSGHLCKPVFKFKLPRRKLTIHSSANGLLLMLNIRRPCTLIICNPFTREYIKLPPPPSLRPSSIDVEYNAFGFEVSKLTRKYKVVRISHECRQYFDPQSPSKCEVYTLGTGSWRSVAAPGSPLRYRHRSSVSLNGNLHWLVEDVKQGGSLTRISCFDLETECFSTFSIPLYGYNSKSTRRLCVLGQSLCFCDHHLDRVVDIWLMNKYGDDESWRKAYSIKGGLAKLVRQTVEPIKMFKNGDIWLASKSGPKLYCYSSKTTKTIQEVDLTKERFESCGFKFSLYVPSFLPLKTFAMENVSTF